MSLSSAHHRYLKERGTNPARLANRYCSSGSDLRILYCDPTGQPYLDRKGEKYVVRRLFPTGKPKFVAPTASGSRPYFSLLMPDGYLEDITIPLVLIEGPVKVDSCYEHIHVDYCFVGLTGTWNIVDRRGDDEVWREDNDTRVLPELKAIPMKGRQVIVIFNSKLPITRQSQRPPSSLPIGPKSAERSLTRPPCQVNLTARKTALMTSWCGTVRRS